MKKSSYLALDPGDMWGWATLDEVGEVTGYGQFHKLEAVKILSELIKDNEFKVIIVEDYRNYGHMNQKKWSRNDTSKGIGKVETLAELHNIPIVLQMANVKIIGYKWAGLGQAPTNHKISHQFDAVAHGVFYCQSNGIRPVGIAIPKEDR